MGIADDIIVISSARVLYSFLEATSLHLDKLEATSLHVDKLEATSNWRNLIGSN